MNGSNCKIVCWVIGAVVGLIAYLLMRPGLVVFWALVVAVVLAVAVAVLLRELLCKQAGDTVAPAAGTGATQSADAVAAPLAAPQPAAAPAAAPQPVAAPSAGPVSGGLAATPASEADTVAAEEAPAMAPAGTNPVAPEGETPAAPQVADATASTAIGEAAKPQGLSAPRDGGADDLKRIKGVGPKMETMLNEMGYYHFDQISAWTAEEVAWVDQNLKGFKGRVSRDNWVEQATLLATGGETDFSKRVDKGGVY